LNGDEGVWDEAHKMFGFTSEARVGTWFIKKKSPPLQMLLAEDACASSIDTLENGCQTLQDFVSQFII
jgi:hypothetical protein